MGWKTIVAVVSVVILSALMIFYFLPLNTIDFGSTGNGNFSSFAEIDGGMQFYSSMRFPESKISYKISGCPLPKQNEMEIAFGVMEDSTILRFYSVDNNEEISITCEETEKPEGNLFIAGEGGPTKVTAVGNFAVILSGEILLIRETKCEQPNVALHELLHVLGFKHSSNPDNIMYNITNCGQTIGDDIIQFINDIYAIPSQADLVFENVSASMSGRFLNVDLSVVNAGLRNSEEFNIKIYAGEELVKEIEMEPVDIGYGRFVSLKNIWVSQTDVSELELIIESEFEEISKENNQIKLQVS